ncbi:MAG: dadX [Paucimonas sp.]|nr:dadX [Paucimonas sp.]
MRGFKAADGLGLVELEGAVKLRELGWKKPVLLLEGFFESADLKLLVRHRLEAAIHCMEQINMLESASLAAPIDVHLKINSGMNRLGFTPAQAKPAYERLRALKSVGNIRFLTHFANADDPANAALSAQEQAKRFAEAVDGLPGERSLSNSAASLLHGEFASDWIRPGVMLYGGSPGKRSAGDFGLQPAMTLSSELIGIQHISRGDAVGYGSRFVAGQAMKIGVVACGYADGYPRHAPTGTPVIVDGIRTQVIGRISMDLMTVDLTPAPDVHVGSKVTLWGKNLPIDEVAQAADTIGYELMCAVAPRVKIAED